MSVDNRKFNEFEQRYVASMVLSGVGDALGYKNGDWEFCHSGIAIHEELNNLGGLDNIKINVKDWMVSDDTVMHIATASALVKSYSSEENLYQCLALEYKESMRDMRGRAPGNTCMMSCHDLRPGREHGWKIPFNSRGGGCGAAMRAMCIGLRYPWPHDQDDLIRVSVESGRMTHHHPTGYLGALAAALFVSYAIQGKPLPAWGAGLIETLSKAKEFVKKSGRYVEDNLEAWDYFESSWINYLLIRQLSSSSSEIKDPVFPPDYGVEERDKFYKSLSYSGWGGSSGHDAPMIAYDALLSSSLDWKELCSRSMFHSGDSDSTGVIAAACYGAMKGFEGVPENNYNSLEYRDKLELLGKQLYRLVSPTTHDVAEVNPIATDEQVEKILSNAPDVPDDNTAEVKPTETEGKVEKMHSKASTLPDTPDTKADEVKEGEAHL